MMTGLLEVFAIDEALRKFNYVDLCSACLGLLQAMGYAPFCEQPPIEETWENFVYFSVPNKVHFSSQEMAYLQQICSVSAVYELHGSDIRDARYDENSIVFLSVDLRCPQKDRSDSAYYITQILNKTHNNFVVILFRHSTAISICSCVSNDSCVCMSEWYDTEQPDLEDLYPLLSACYPYIYGIETVKDLHEEMCFAFSREYMKYSESYEYVAFQCIPNIELIIGDSLVTREHIKDFAEQSKNYYPNMYGDDYIIADDSFEVMAEEDDAWTLLELDDFVPPDAEIDDYEEDLDEIDEDFIDYSELDEETLNDPVKLLKWLEERNGDSDGD